ncbi:MAG TPA: tRNA 2-selenouridine(34) synthase MnmH [Pelomicrobium sp.]|nr:tRNA 2-selenouridine(34) synthase MnmH [Pelomicrobium sp.]
MKREFQEPETLAQLDEFDEVVDVRSPSEFRDDHIPGAINLPVLSDAERARVGTLYKQASPFEAKKVGAALISRNIAAHIETCLQDRPRTWRPLVYCWRGGTRSGAMAHILREIGWRAGRLAGGYKAYRHHVIADLQALPGRLQWRVLCGPTGAGKTRLLAALARQGAQTLDLEGLAAHRGSVLGDFPDAPQPSQKLFESRLWDALRRLDASRPVFVEAESKKIGRLHLPDALVQAMWSSRCVALETAITVRVALLKDEYTHLLANRAALFAKLDCLAALHGHAVIDAWKALAEARAWDEFVARLLEEHYDPAYRRSTGEHYPQLDRATRVVLDSADDATLDRAARAMLDAG